MIIDSFDYTLPPEFPYMLKLERLSWRKILEIAKSANQLYLDLPESIKQNTIIEDWVCHEISSNLNSLYQIYINKELFTIDNYSDILPFLLTTNRSEIGNKWILFILSCQRTFLYNNEIEYPDISCELSDLIDVTDFEMIFPVYDGPILEPSDEENLPQSNYIRYFPTTEPNFSEEMFIEFGLSEIYSHEKRQQIGWLKYCDHLNSLVGKPTLIEVALEESYSNFIRLYGQQYATKWIINFQANLDKQVDLEPIILPIIRSWLNTLIDFRKNLFADEDSNSGVVKIEGSDKEIKKVWEAFEDALLIYLKSFYSEVKLEGNLYKVVENQDINFSFRHVTNQLYSIKRYLHPNKKSTLSKERFLQGLTRIIDDPTLFTYHGRAKNIRNGINN